MASWGSPRGRAYHTSSPISPLSPLSPSALPQWLRTSRSRHGLFSNGRGKMFLLAAVCLAAGWLVTSMLGPGEEILELDEQISYEAASVGVLNDPSGFGSNRESGKRPGIIGADEDEEEDSDNEQEAGLGKTPKKPSVSGALSELHHAVSDTIQSWNPYFAKHPNPKIASSLNRTSKAKTKANFSYNTTLLAGESIKDGISEDDRLGARTRIGKMTILFSGNAFWERCVRTHEQHDRVHGYRLHILRHQLMDDVWSKPAYILSTLLRELSKPPGDRLDWLFWVDADTVILNPYIPIETFLPPPGTEFDDIYLMYSNDWNGLNNGVFPIRVNQWAVHLFAAIVSFRHFKPDDPLVFRDQSAMNSLMQEPEFAKHIIQAPQRWFNAYQGEHNETLQPFQVRRGDLLVHFAGIPAREERMQYWLERAEQNLDEWQMPVKSTSYPQEAKIFWDEQKELRKHKKAKLEETKAQAAKLLETTDQHLSEYGERLNEEERTKITEKHKELRKITEEEKTKEDVAKLEEGMKGLTESLISLTNAQTEANKLLLQAAHEAIFAGEKDLLEAGFSQGSATPDLEQISTAVKNLKAMVMAPEESWVRNDITSATNTVTEARAKWQEKVALELATQKKLQEEQAANAKALSEAQKAAQQEAEEAEAGTVVVWEDEELPTALEEAAESEADGSEESLADEVQHFVIVTAPTVTEFVTTTSEELLSPT